MTSWKSLATVLSDQRFVRSAWRKRLEPGSHAAVLFAVACVAIAAVVRFALNLFSSDVVPFATFYPATLMATLVGGFWVGILAAVLAGVAGLLFLKSQLIPFGLTSADSVSILLYLAASAVIIWGAEQYRRLVRQFEQEEAYRQILVDELGHRLQNKLATIHAILRYELRDQRDIRDRISGRLQALSATDELIVKPQATGIEINALLIKELAPYDASRAIIEGPSIEVPPKLAVTLALVFHELATNAAKYGALASPQGRLVISLKSVGQEAVIEWRETGGPQVMEPTRRGFGRRIIEEGLTPFGGKVECRFGPTGLECTIVVPSYSA
jgi:two-component sensor histidine kinase